MNVHDATNAIRAFLSASSSTTTILLAVMYVTRLGVEDDSRVRARAMVATTTHGRISGATQTEVDFWIDVDEHAVVAWSRPSDAAASATTSIENENENELDDNDNDGTGVAPYRRGSILSAGAPIVSDRHSNSLERLTRAYQAGIDLASTLAMSSTTASGN